MQVFKTFMKITKKRLNIFIIYIVCFVSICVIITKTTSQDSSFESSQAEVIITDLDNTPESRALINFISKHHKVSEKSVSEEKIPDLIFYRRADIILTIEKGFSEKISKGETEEIISEYNVPGTFIAELFDSSVNQFIKTVTAYTVSGMDISDAMEKAGELCSAETEVERVNFKEETNSEYNYLIANFFQYIPYIVLSILITGLCPTLLVLTEKDIRNRTNCSCVTSTRQILEMILGTVVIVTALYLLLMGVAAALFGDMLFGSLGLRATLNTFVFMIFSTMLTLLISLIAKNVNTLNMIAQIFGLGMCFLCGVFVPQMVLSDTVLSIEKFLPVYWYVRANNMLAGSNNEVYSDREFMICLGIELAFAFTLFCLTLLTAKMKRSSKTTN